MAALLYSSICIISILQSSLTLLFIAALIFRLKRDKSYVCIIVLGDIGRSPRMQYHAKSLISEGYKVTFVGYSGSSPIKSLSMSDHVSFKYLMQWPKNVALPGFMNYIFKATFISIQLFLVLLFKTSVPGYFLVQNPPSIPSLLIVWLMSCLKGATMITDWHNYGYTILSLNVKRSTHPLVKFAKWYEGFFGFFSHENICVTKAMQQDLLSKWKISANVLYDKPPAHFKQLVDPEEKANLFKKLIDSGCFDENKGHPLWDSLSKLATAPPCEHPAIIISSTSWTEDEDFSILLEALENYDVEKSQQTSSLLFDQLPNIICIITGKGPLKKYYKQKINELKLKHVLVTTPWLESDEYPKVIGSGDLGICLHLSSSGLDLPMKVVDMFGCCLPVCAVSFPCLDELVQHNVNGLTFSTSEELANQMKELLMGFPGKSTRLLNMRCNLENGFSKNRWHKNWKDVMLPILKN